MIPKINKAQLKRIIVMKTQRFVIEDIRELPQEIGGGYIERAPNNRCDWILPDIRYCFGGSGRRWQDTKNELIDGIWNYLNDKPVQKGKHRICDVCQKRFVQVNKAHRFCGKECSDAFWHRGGSLEYLTQSVKQKMEV